MVQNNRRRTKHMMLHNFQMNWKSWHQTSGVSCPWWTMHFWTIHFLTITCTGGETWQYTQPNSIATKVELSGLLHFKLTASQSLLSWNWILYIYIDTHVITWFVCSKRIFIKQTNISNTQPGGLFQQRRWFAATTRSPNRSWCSWPQQRRQEYPDILRK